MAQAFASWEKREKRVVTLLRVIGRLITCTYLIPGEPAAVSDIIPARGAVMPEAKREGLWDGDDEVMAPRLRDWRYGKQQQGGKTEIIVEYIQCLPYSG